MLREQAKAIIEKLVERFAEHRKEYHLAEYNEQKTRQDFINPFFKALGWDIDNEKGDSSDWTFNNNNLTSLIEKFKKCEPLDKIVSMGQGIKSGLNETFIVNEETINKWNLERTLLEKYVKTRDIQKFQIYFRNLYLILSLNDTKIDNYPNTKKYLQQFKRELEERYQFKDAPVYGTA